MGVKLLKNVTKLASNWDAPTPVTKDILLGWNELSAAELVPHRGCHTKIMWCSWLRLVGCIFVRVVGQVMLAHLRPQHGTKRPRHARVGNQLVEGVVTQLKTECIPTQNPKKNAWWQQTRHDKPQPHHKQGWVHNAQGVTLGRGGDGREQGNGRPAPKECQTRCHVPATVRGTQSGGHNTQRPATSQSRRQTPGRTSTCPSTKRGKSRARTRAWPVPGQAKVFQQGEGGGSHHWSSWWTPTPRRGSLVFPWLPSQGGLDKIPEGCLMLDDTFYLNCLQVWVQVLTNCFILSWAWHLCEPFGFQHQSPRQWPKPKPPQGQWPRLASWTHGGPRGDR